MDIKVHVPTNETNELVEVGEEVILPDILVGCIWNLQYSETSPGDEILEVVKEGLHVDVSMRRKVIAKVGASIFQKVFPLQAVNRTLECSHDPELINWVNNFAHTAGIFLNHAIRNEVANDFIVQVEIHTFIVRADLHQDSFKAQVSADIGQEVLNITILFTKEPRVCV